MEATNITLFLIGVILVLCFILMLMNRKEDENNENENNKEHFDPVIDAIESHIKNKNPEELRNTIQLLQQRLIDYGYAPDLKNYIKKTELNQSSGKCLVSNAEDRDKYISKTDVPPQGPRIDLSQYVKKSSIPPEKVCPPAPTIDLSAYVKKSTLPPNEKCPPCIAPKVKVSAGLCRACPPPPPCPAPEPCPTYSCPAPEPCPTQKECKKCDEIRYIKVPALITKTIMVDDKGNVISQKIDSGNPTTTMPLQTTTTRYTLPATTTTYVEPSPHVTMAPKSIGQTFFNSLFSTYDNIPTTTFPTTTTTPNITLAQTLDNNNNNTFCPSSNLNTEFKEYSKNSPIGLNVSSLVS